MASSSVANFFSFFTSPKPQPIKTPVPSQLPLSPVSSSSSSSRSKNGLAAQFEGLSLSTADNQQFPSSTASSSELMSVICPSLAYTNTLFFSTYNIQLVVEENEPEEKLVSRFRREVMRTGIIQECKRRRYFENKQEEKKRRIRDAAKRNRRRRQFSRGGLLEKQVLEETSNGKKEEDDDEDNWDLPDGDLPY